MKTPPATLLTPEQRQRRIARGACFIGLAFFAGCFYPALAGWDMMRYGYGAATLSFFLVICASVTAALYWMRAAKVRQLFEGESLLTTWTCPPEQWRVFLREDFAEEASAKRGLLAVVAFFILVIGAGFWLFDPEAGRVVFFILLGVLTLIAVVAVVMPKLHYRHRLRHGGDSWIGRSGVWTGGMFHDWRSFGAELDSARVAEEDRLPVLEIAYRFPSRTGWNDVVVRIPVPPGREQEARAVAAVLNAPDAREGADHTFSLP